MPVLMHRGHRLDLVCVQARNALCLQRLQQGRRQRGAQFGVACRPRRDETLVYHLAIISWLSLEFLEKRADIHTQRPRVLD